jgi:hypothetical protein
VLGFFQPRAAGGQGLLGGPHGPGVVPLARLGQLVFQLRDGRAELGHGALRPGQRLGVGPAPLGLLGLAHRFLDPPQPGLQVLAGVPRHRADLLPPLLDAAQRGPGGPDVGHRQQPLGLVEQLLLGLGVLAQRGVLGREHLRAGGEELILRRPEALPKLGLGLPVRAPGPLPLAHQLAERAGGRPPLGRGRQRLGLGAQILLAGPHVLPLGLQRREVRLAPLGERVTGGGQPLPQHGLGGPLGVRGRLPLIQQLAHPLAAALPVRRLGGDLLGLGDDPLLDLLGLHPGLLPGRLGFLAALADVLGQPLQAAAQPLQVAQRVRLADGLDQPLDRRRGLGGRHVGSRDPLLEQHHLGLQRLVLTLVERECLLRAPRLPRADHPLAVGGTDIDRPVGIYPAPRMVGGRHGEPPALSCSCQVFLIVTLSMMTFFLGAPPPACAY